MVMKFSILSIILLLLAQGEEAQAGNFDITKYGAKADGHSDISQAFTKVWTEACASTTPSTIVIPKGTYLLNPVKIHGPCKAPLQISLKGTLKAPVDPNQMQTDGWITINYVDRLTISGGGTFDGQGTLAWKQNDCNKNTKCKQLPMNLRFNFITNSIVHDVTSLDSKNFHVNVIGCKNLTFQHFTITAPETSINTDGIHMGDSVGINITNSDIKTGDDCISIGDGSQHITIEKVTCGPGHGFSVGSLGRSKNEDPVIGVTVRNCTLTNTMNGVRIKTWPSSTMSSVVSGMHFEDIIMNNVGNPVLIDQEYCPSNLCDLRSPSLVKISDVSFNKIRGTSSSPVAVKLVCSKAHPCEKVVIGDLDLKYTGNQGSITSLCKNVSPTFSGKQNPPVCGKSAQSS